MIIKSSSKFKLLKSMVLLIPFFLITFFILTNNVMAAKFKYSEFDFEEFSKENLGYWTNECAESTDNDKDLKDCQEKTLKSQEQFYTRLYKLLAKYESKGYFIDDTTIITTVFYELDPITFADDSLEYKKENGKDDDSNSYYEDDDDLTNYEIDTDYENGETAADYFEQEKDTLKLLLRSMIGYKNYCYGIYSSTTTTNEDGVSVTTCKGGVSTTINGKTYCASFISSNPSGFWDHLMRANGVQSFLGIKSDKEKECNEHDNGTYDKGILFYTDKTQSVNEELYWQFLEISNYFDRKPHLQNKFNRILNKLNKKNMSELTEEEYEEYNDQIIEIRKEIIEDIKSIIKDFKGDKDEKELVGINQTLFWWPIGSSETNTTNGKLFATKDPATVNITSPFGNRDSGFHKGIDISDGSEPGKVYIIASQSGVVTKVEDSCLEGDEACGGGYGNHIIINHNDGNYYTVYAHLHSEGITVKQGDSVEKGQVIGKMGNTGSSTGTHLHFEVRTGADSSYAVDPLDYVDPENPRQSSSGGEIVDFIASFEGTGPISGNYYKVYCNSGDIPTVGHGITLKYNKQLFSKYGLNADDYTCGDLIPIDIMDQIYYDRLEQDKQGIASTLASQGISNLQNYQLDALVSLRFNCGNIEGFSNAYKSYGTTEALCNNWWNNKSIMAGTQFEKGLRNRRKHECKLFLTGVYDGNN